MSIRHSTTNSSKFKTLFSPTLSIQYGRIIWPKGMPYPAWQNLLKYSPIVNSKKRQKKHSPHRRREFLKIKEHQRDEIMENHIEKIIDIPKYSEQPDNEDIKVELITILKQFLDRKHLS